MADAVRRYAALGYTWMKYHLSPFENVIDQMEAMQEAAPKGFKIHHDLTMGGTDDHIVELIEKISRFPIAGCIEDPLPEKDIDGYAELRQKCRLPILYHHAPLGAGLETQRRSADGYILGHA
jgi:L-alanine-DL-glutamate epimerase-like enolase superfamily enzyme